MKIIGLTGGVGMGKSTTADLLTRRGLPVVDTDLLAREVVEPGQPALEEIRKNFGSDIVDATGHLLRAELARRVFADEAARRRLEAIVHPRIRERWLAQIDLWRAEGRAGGVVVIPLLFETNAMARFDAIICVACSPAAQRERLLARGWTAEQIDERIRAQWPIEKKMLHSHFVVWTDSSLEAHAEQLDWILRGLNLPPPTR
jgi:dephospho-CoA kinase